MKAPGILNLIGGLLTLIIAIGTLALGALFAAVMPMMGILGAIAGILGIWGVIVGLLLIVSAVYCEKNKNWATIGLVFSILGLITGQGFFVGPILGIIGSALALSRSK